MNLSFKLILIGLFLLFIRTIHAQEDENIPKIEYKMDSVSINLAPDSKPITVYVYFVVDSSGHFSEVEARKIICKKCDESTKEHFKKLAVDAVASSPSWDPGDKKLKPMSFLMPIKFIAEKE
mgnify:CR=1 FL=1